MAVVNTIEIPGISDIIRVPALEDAELKRERIQRMRAAHTALPGVLNWLPAAINHIDDAQDILITALILGKPILRRLPVRFLPVLGWVLLVNDLLNGVNALLEIATGGAVGKLNFYNTLLSAFGGRSALVKKASKFLRSGTKWFPFVVQAGQVLRTFTGYGLQLGGVFGAVSDTFWGGLKAFGGQPIRVIGPPPSDPLYKAARVLSQTSYLPFITAGLTEQEITMIMASYNAAVGFLIDPLLQPVDDNRLAEYADFSMPLYEPWSPASRAALSAEGLDPSGPFDHALPFVNRWPTFSEAFRAGSGAGGSWDVDVAPQMSASGQSQAAHLFADEAAQAAFDVWGEPGSVEKALTPFEQMMGFAHELGVFPPWSVSSCPAPDTPGFVQFRPPGFNCVAYTYPDTNALPDLHSPAFTPAYPAPPGSDQEKQIEWFANLALYLYCGFGLELPVFTVLDSAPARIDAWTTNRIRRGRESVVLAALYTWGNYWLKEMSPPSGALPLPRQKVCQLTAGGLPSLYGAPPASAGPGIPIAIAH